MTTPLGPGDFVSGYTLPYILVAIVQGTLLLVVGAMLGLEIDGSVALVALILLMMAVFYVSLGMVLGALLNVAQVAGAYAVVLLLTIFGGAWFDLEEIGGVFLTVGDGLPFKHALDATRAVMADGAGLGDVAGDVYWIAGYTIAVSGLAILAFKRRMLE